jgi:PadR family transcriptional regulator PadR
MKTENLRIILLKMFMGQEFYGYEIHKKLVTDGVEINLSRLYRVLNEMLKEGIFVSSWEKSEFGPKKRTYKLGKKGQEKLREIMLDAIHTVHRFYERYLVKLPPEISVFPLIFNLILGDIESQTKVGYIISSYSKMHKAIVLKFIDRLSKGDLYVIKPDSIDLEMNYPNLIFLNGTYDQIPLKNDYIERLVVIGIPDKSSLDSALQEWQRVLKVGGSMTIVTPTVLMEKKDPLSLGAFIESYEHGSQELDTQVNKKLFLEMLSKIFKKIKEKKIIHMTLLLMSDHIKKRN